MAIVDWAILLSMIIFLIIVALRMYKHNKSVADFLAANRCAGKYVLAVSDGMAALGSITIIAMFEMYYKAGFSAYWWSLMMLPVGVIIAMTGWIQYRYRQTRVMTMAQFFEIRYSRNFRIVSGIICWISGTINFAVFPAVGGRFFQYYLGLSPYNVQLGNFNVDLVFAAIMFVFITIALAFTLMGGQIVVMVTDFFQGLFCNVVLVAIGVYLLLKMDWTIIGQALALAPKNASMINPMHSGGADNFNVSFFLIGAISSFWMFMAWQGNQGFYCAAKSPHEAKMGRVLGNFRPIIQSVTLLILPIGAYVFFHHPHFDTLAYQAKQVLSGIAVGNEQLSSQLRTTIAVKSLLPIGLIGAFAAVMFAATIATHDTYLHAWGSIFIQDVVLPIRQMACGESTPLSQKLHMRWLRISITGIAVFVFFFSLVFDIKQDIYMYFALTGMLFTGWAGTVIVGGLYWKYGTATGAWISMFFGILMFLLSWTVIYQWQSYQHFFSNYTPSFWDHCIQRWPELTNKFPINAQYLLFYSMLGSIVCYFVVSMLDSKGKAFNLDKMLHRGKYSSEVPKEHPKTKFTAIWRLLGMGEDFNLEDRCIFGISYGYIIVFFGMFAIGTIYALNVETLDSSWLTFWKVSCWGTITISIVLTIWLAIGGIRDLKEMLSSLSNVKRNIKDDGTVVKTQD
jgi:SSS family solute:Na+ symporter